MGEGGGFGWGGEKMQTTVIEQQLKKMNQPINAQISETTTTTKRVKLL